VGVSVRACVLVRGEVGVLTCEAKVADLGRVILADKTVACCEVTVHDTDRLEILHALGHVCSQQHHPPFRDRRLFPTDTLCGGEATWLARSQHRL
jgi:hypothetical protein